MPSSPELQRASQLASQRSFAEAERILARLLQEHPDDVAALNLLGFVVFFQGRYVEAERACRHVLDIAPREPYATLGLANSLAKQGRIDDAIAYFEQAALARPAWFDAYWDWAVALQEAGRMEDAELVAHRGQAALPQRSTEWRSLLSHCQRSTR